MPIVKKTIVREGESVDTITALLNYHENNDGITISIYDASKRLCSVECASITLSKEQFKQLLIELSGLV